MALLERLVISLLGAAPLAPSLPAWTDSLSSAASLGEPPSEVEDVAPSPFAEAAEARPRSSLLATLAMVGAAVLSPTLLHAVPWQGDGDKPIQLVAFGDGSSGGRHHGRKAQSSSAPADTPAKAPPPETAEQHKAYLNKYGFDLK